MTRHSIPAEQTSSLGNSTAAVKQGIFKVSHFLFTKDMAAVGAAWLALLTCIWIAHPFADSPFNDDWSYSRVALRLAETGHFEYNGWGGATIVFQSLWGALFICLFGFSFDVLRLATLPFSLGFVALTYLLAREAGLRKMLAFFAALTLAVSPLLIPVVASFMTEPYSCFFSLLCVYAALRCAQAVGSRTEILWLWVLALSGILGGSNRQTVWAAPLFLIPYLYWIKRPTRKLRVHSTVAYSFCLIALFYITHTFGQKHMMTELSIHQWISIMRTNSLGAIHRLLSLFLEGFLLCLPALLALLPLWKRLRRQQMVWALLGSLLALDFLWSVLGRVAGLAPFLGNTLSPFGIFEWMGHGLGTRPSVLRLAERIPLTFLLLISIAAWLLLSKGTAWWRTLSRAQISIYLIFALSYLPFLLPGALTSVIFDRYLLPLFPLLLIIILLPLSTRTIPAVAWVCLLLFSIYGVVITRDCYAELIARAAIAKRATQHGIPADHISAGFERDGWFQISQTGHITPPLYGQPLQWDSTHFWFWYFTQAIRPDYVAVSSYGENAVHNAVLVMPFRAWISPHKRTISLVRREDIPKE